MLKLALYLLLLGATACAQVVDTPVLPFSADVTSLRMPVDCPEVDPTQLNCRVR